MSVLEELKLYLLRERYPEQLVVNGILKAKECDRNALLSINSCSVPIVESTLRHCNVEDVDTISSLHRHNSSHFRFVDIVDIAMNF